MTSAQTKQLEQQNIRLKEALVRFVFRNKFKYLIIYFLCVRLRDLSNQEKLDHQAVQKALEKQTTVVKNLTSQNEKLKAENAEAETMIDDLKDQVHFFKINYYLFICNLAGRCSWSRRNGRKIDR